MKHEESESPLGYYVPQNVWEQLNVVVEKLSVLRSIAESSPQEEMMIDSGRLQSLMREIQDRLKTVEESGKFCSRP